MTDPDPRLDALRQEIWALVRRACPHGTADDTHVALAALTDVLTAIFVGMGPERLPLVEDICRDIGAEILRQVREAHGLEGGAAGAVH